MANIQFTNALERKVQKVPPIWMMRQAGRYNKPYQEMRAKYSFMELCKIPELAAKVALGPIQDFDFDVSILFSDLLFPLDGIGMGLTYTDSGPSLEWHLDDSNFSKLKSAEEAVPTLQFQKEAMKLTRELIPKNKSVIGFVGGVWTLFTYAVMGTHAGTLTKPKQFVTAREKFIPLMNEILIQNIQFQLDGGAEIVLMIDTASGDLSPYDFSNIVIPSVKYISSKFPKKIGYYGKGLSENHVKQIFEVNTLSGIGFDHRLSLPEIIPQNKIGFTQGNFDQSLLFLEKFEFLNNLNVFINSMKNLSPEDRAGWVCGLGHGILPKTPESNVKLFVERVREVFSNG